MGLLEDQIRTTHGEETDPEEPKIPSQIPILPVRDVVLYPYTVAPLVIQRPGSAKLIDDAAAGSRIVGVVTQRETRIEDPGPKDLYEIGSAGLIHKMLKIPDGSVRILVQGLARIRIRDFAQTDPYLKANVTVLEEVMEKTLELEGMTRNISNQFRQVVSLTPHLPDELQVAISSMDHPGRMADLVAFSLPNLSSRERQDILEMLDVKTRLEHLMVLLGREVEVLEVGTKIQTQVQTEMGKLQREFWLRKQLEEIRKELGEENERETETQELRERIEQAGLPEEAKQEAERELNRLAKMPAQAAEYTVARTYLDWLLDLPWNTATEDRLDIVQARKVLDEDHYDLEKIKERILEYLAVRKLKSDMKGPILCLVGPPGTGKTSLGRSIAQALGRKFVRISLGGVRDEAEIRGHRRTYVGALPGRIIQGMKKAGSNNPVFMMDEVDKIGADFRGDPSAALLEVLDPEQNSTFSDHYLEVPFDLSNVMFVTTANTLAPVPPALLDRMEVITLTGYTQEQKRRIAQQYLIPRQLEAHGLTGSSMELADEALLRIIREYTREAGLRNLEREIAQVCRKVAKTLAEEEAVPGRITADRIPDFLGPQRFFNEVAERSNEPGVATGLAWTQAGGDIIFIEATKMRGSKNLILTGQLGEVMKESAQAALSFVRSRANRLGLREDFFQKNDIHIHVPSGGIPKDGPSAGIAITTALVSLLTDRPVRPGLAMTGEVTLRGKVLPVGGIKEKVLAARRAGIDTVILPKWNEQDLDELAEDIRKELHFKFVDRMDEVLGLAVFWESGWPKEPKEE
ncbi:MAG: endopeptidase La [Candidatus Latescibacterota bacterium]